jgi:glycosyltransferase involved in cell wall biosynthesis
MGGVWESSQSNKAKAMKILIAAIFFRKYTGSELYVLHVAKGLKALGHDVTITSPNLGDPIATDAADAGIAVLPWRLLTGHEGFDVIHTQHKNVTESLCQIYPNTPKVATIHSVHYDLEQPVFHPTIKGYVSIANHEKHQISAKYGVPLDKIEVIYNPIDHARFNADNITDKGYVLLAGTIDYMRKAMIYDVAEWCKQNAKQFVLVGYDHGDYLQDLLWKYQIEYQDAMTDIECLLKDCHMAAGLHIGRTTIEAWMCGKSVISYQFTEAGGITKRKILTAPDDIDNYRIDVVSKQLEALYLKAMKP